MEFELFYNKYQKIAEKETRRITIIERDINIPGGKGEFAFVEAFCNDKDCDCRRVMFNVTQLNEKYPIKHYATIAYGWENINFYKKWSFGMPEDIIRMFKGPIDDPTLRQTKYSPIFLDMFKHSLLPDKDYMERVKRHYFLFKLKLGGKAIKELSKNIDKYSFCPCNSGKKFKYCCYKKIK